MKHTSSLSSMTRIRPIKRSPSQAEITRDEFISALCNLSGYLPTTQRTDRNNSATCWGVNFLSSVYVIPIKAPPMNPKIALSINWYLPFK